MGGRGGTSVGVTTDSIGSVNHGGQSKDLTVKIGRVPNREGIHRLEITASSPDIIGGEDIAGMQVVVNFESDRMRVSSVMVGAAIQGQGVAQRFYATAMLEAKKLGISTFASDSNVSNEAVKVWEKLGKRISVSKSDKAYKSGHQWVTGDGTSIFSVKLDNISKATLEDIKRGK